MVVSIVLSPVHVKEQLYVTSLVIPDTLTSAVPWEADSVVNVDALLPAPLRIQAAYLERRFVF